MKSQNQASGVFSPVLTPFDSDLNPDIDRLIEHCKWLLSYDVGLALFGTNSEANSLSVAERRLMLEKVVETGMPAKRMLPGTSTCNLPETVELTKHAVDLGVLGTLMLPPFYYKGVSDDGLFDYFSRVIEGVGSKSLRIYLYHIPQVTEVPISLSLIERLIKSYPQVIKGIKDSGGDWENTRSMIDEFSEEGFDVYAGSEPFLLQVMQAGGAGCVSATANVNPGAISKLYREWNYSDAGKQQSNLNRVRRAFSEFPMIPAMKAAVSRLREDSDWLNVRPPLVRMGAGEREMLFEKLDSIGFEMESQETA
ncbi:dihydrodipicolinate synthase family protein [Salinicola peritrichatus]|uniref:dihydrodipicolinate synthase family protein n=1 Tax=Salinicola peritrichatus TaxID=1267424 RepID=UPI000DA11CB2|nr:dihydrodipicolinate synthase family protein [Salinicola peritrichatus]